MTDDDLSGRDDPGTPPTVGVIGLGSIGDGVASSLLRAGLPVVVCDVRREATDRYRDRATVAGSPAELARPPTWSWWPWSTTDRSVRCCPARRAAWPRPIPGPVVVIVSTISTACVEALGAEAAALGVACARLRGQRRAVGGGRR